METSAWVAGYVVVPGGSVGRAHPELGEQRHRFIARLGMAACVLLFVAAALEGLLGDPQVALLFAVACSAFVGVVVASLRRVSSELLGHAMTATLWLLLGSLTLIRGGGLTAPALFALPAVPALAALSTGPRGALIWSVLSILPLPLFALWSEHIVTDQVAVHGVGMVRGVALAAGVILVAVTVLTYEDTQRAQAKRLTESRQAALASREAADAARAQAELANRAKSAFLATMSHEIRTPLTAVVGVAEVLRGAGLDAQHSRQLALLEGAGRTLLGLVDDILDLSRIESGQLHIEAVPVDVASIVREIGSILQTRAATRGVALRYRHDGPGFIEGDPLRLRQILLNLVGNAIKFTEDGEVELLCRVEERAEDDLLDLTFTVRDTGIGIPKDVQAAVFWPFTQAEQGTARRFGGSGLGLSIVAQLVRLMNGTIDLKSTPGEGSTVTVRAVFSPAQPPATETIPVQEAVSSPRHVLLAEDNEINQEVVRLMLERCGCTVQVAPDGFRAVQAVVDTPESYDLILMDCQMPGMDGFEATRTLRAAGWTRPIVALTANATPADRAACMAAGMDDFTSKPLTLAELRKVLQLHAPRT